MPNILKLFINEENIPSFMNDTVWGHRFWGAIITVKNINIDNNINFSILYCFHYLYQGKLMLLDLPQPWE